MKCELSKTRRFITGTAVIAGSLALVGCGERVQGIDTNDGVVIETEIGDYSVRCYGPNMEVITEEGDSLSGLIDRVGVNAPTIIGGLGIREVPIEVFTQTIAEMNEIDDHNLIPVNQAILLPDTCIAE